jgi:phage terminase small subunit
MFVREYLVDLNATQAAIRAGYSAKTAEQQGPRLLGNVGIAEAIQAGMDKRASKTGITAERVLAEIAKLAFFDPRKLFDDAGRPIHISQLDDDTAAAVSGLDVVTQGNSEVGIAEILKVKLADKGQNLERLGRHLKLFTDKVEMSGAMTVVVKDFTGRPPATDG